MRFPRRIGDFGLVGSHGPATLLEMYRKAVNNYGKVNLVEEIKDNNLEVSLVSYHHNELGVVRAILRRDDTDQHSVWIDLEKVTADGVEDVDAIRLESLVLEDIDMNEFCENLIRTVKEWGAEHNNTIPMNEVGQYW